MPSLRHHHEARLDDPVRLHAGDVPALEQDPALGRLDQAADGVEKGRLTDPVRPDSGHHFAGQHLEVEALEDLQVPIAGVETFDVEQRVLGDAHSPR